METISTIKDQLSDTNKVAYDGYELMLGARKLEDE
jgi:hypothetical protein